MNNSACSLCVPGTWCWTGILNNCPSNTNSDAQSSYQDDCTCNVGYSGSGPSCTQCGVGLYAGSQGSTACVACAIGSYCPNATVQIPCASGQYCPNSSATVQLSCSAGTYQSGSGMTSCTKCIIGTYNPTEGASSESACMVCPAGYFCEPVIDPLAI
jgi:Tyrosine-protein kinase ephrin type A/B receptor-like